MDKIFIRLLSPDEVGEKYLSWMNDEETVRFLDSRWKRYTLDDLRKYVEAVNQSDENFMFGIYLKNERGTSYIGNVKVGPIHKYHRFADVGILIGEKSVWGKGCGSEALRLVSEYAFERLNVNKLTAAMVAENQGSYKAFIKAGFSKAGYYKKHHYIDGQYSDVILVDKGKYDSSNTAG